MTLDSEENNAKETVEQVDQPMDVTTDTERSEIDYILEENTEKVDCEKPTEKKDSNNETDSTTQLPKGLLEDDFEFKCYDCGVRKCAMWRKLDTNSILCNLCHFKRVKNSGQPQTIVSQSKVCNTSNIVNHKSKELQVPRISKRKSKTNKKFANGVYDRIIKNGNCKNRRTLFKKKPTKGADGVASIVTSQSVYHNGLLYESGDIVCTSDVEGGRYYAQLRGFLQDDFCEKSAVVTWLIPTKANLSKFDPMLFVPGLDEDTPRPMECFDFVCRAPISFFKSKKLHPPYLRSQVTLENLIVAANSINNEFRSIDTETHDSKETNNDIVLCRNDTNAASEEPDKNS